MSVHSRSHHIRITDDSVGCNYEVLLSIL